MRSRFDEQLALLNQQLIEMGALCEEGIEMASRALTEGDKELAKQVAPLDSEIDQKERNIESLCLRLLLQQQPVATDLRKISSALKMITDMERIGDQAEDIAEIVQFLDEPAKEEALIHKDGQLREMAKATIRMVTESIHAYVKHDIKVAEQVLKPFTQNKMRLAIVGDFYDCYQTSMRNFIFGCNRGDQVGFWENEQEGLAWLTRKR